MACGIDICMFTYVLFDFRKEKRRRAIENIQKCFSHRSDKKRASMDMRWIMLTQLWWNLSSSWLWYYVVMWYFNTSAVLNKETGFIHNAATGWQCIATTRLNTCLILHIVYMIIYKLLRLLIFYTWCTLCWEFSVLNVCTDRLLELE